MVFFIMTVAEDFVELLMEGGPLGVRRPDPAVCYVPIPQTSRKIEPYSPTLSLRIISRPSFVLFAFIHTFTSSVVSGGVPTLRLVDLRRACISVNSLTISPKSLRSIANLAISGPRIWESDNGSMMPLSLVPKNGVERKPAHHVLG